MAHFFVADVETTGMDPGKDRVVDLGGAWLEWPTPEPRPIPPPASWFIDPEGMHIPAESSAVHHITDVDIELARERGELFKWADARMMLFSGREFPGYIAAHNNRFDSGWLTPDITAPAVWIDTLRCALQHPGSVDAPKHTNQFLRYWLIDNGWFGKGQIGASLSRGVANVAHRAGPDAYVTAHILWWLLEDLCARWGRTTEEAIAQMVAWSTGPALLTYATFGKHTGERWANLPQGYLQWCLNNIDDNEDVQHTVRTVLDRRRWGMDWPRGGSR